MTTPSEKFYRARVIERTDFSDDLWSIRIDPGGEFSYRAGQYATLGVVTPAKHIERAYSIVSSPYEKSVEFFIERVQNGELTPLLYDLRVGDTLTCRKVAKGRFTLDTASGRTNHLLLCTVTGVAPFVSYVRTLLRDASEGRFRGEHRLFLIEGASHSSEFGYSEELQNAVARAPWLTYVPTVSRPWGEPAWKGEVGRVDDLIRKYADQWSLRPETTTVYLCGHPSMVENGKDILHRSGWQKAQMNEEKFFIPSNNKEVLV
jgi:ferredoxin/flavodoxin---NADP+ reductase